jgi:hypothetical protein
VPPHEAHSSTLCAPLLRGTLYRMHGQVFAPLLSFSKVG